MVTLTNYWDVWGNKKDGFEVNDVSKYQISGTEKDFANELSILRLLKKAGFVKKTAKTASLAYDFWSENEVELTCKKTGKPLCLLTLE
jgi:hypothetical protein